MKLSRILSNWYLVGMAALTFVFLGQLATATPMCTNCSVNLVAWALPRADWLMVGWLIAAVNEIWMARHKISGLFSAQNSEATGREVISDET